MPFEYIDRLDLNLEFWGAALDTPNGYGYFSTVNYSGAEIAKIDLATFQHVDTLNLPNGEDVAVSMCIDSGVLYVLCCGNVPSGSTPYLVRVALATFTRIDSLGLGNTYGSTVPQAIVIDPDTNLMYYARQSDYLWRIDLATFSYLDQLQLSVSLHGALLIDIAGGYLYVGADDNYVIKVDLSGFTETAKIRLTPTTSYPPYSSCEDFANNLMYYVGENGYVYKIDTTTFTQVGSGISIDAGTRKAYGIVYDSIGGYLYVYKQEALAAIAIVRASDMSYMGDIDTVSSAGYGNAAAIDVGNRRAYFGLYAGGGDIIRIGGPPTATTWPFIKFIGAAAVGDLTRHLVDEGDQAGQAREGWLKIKITDLGNQVPDGDYHIPIYFLS